MFLTGFDSKVLNTLC
ncbi:hypothetical protein ACVNP1_01155 [Staphylococcus aureus]